jgi:hypothetical protein
MEISLSQGVRGVENMKKPRVNPPYSCGVSTCEDPVICGLQLKNDPSVVVNVCRQHFIKMMHREPKPEEIKNLPLLLGI